uniref:Uncharacterized protein n=1 Tax=viral metagenome TaxID=1070528 RepID=A0A6H1ZVV0_9ZZZZ
MDKFWLVVQEFGGSWSTADNYRVEFCSDDKDRAEFRMINLKHRNRGNSYFLMESVGFAKIGCTSGAVYADPI